jgi:hypothetical protein
MLLLKLWFGSSKVLIFVWISVLIVAGTRLDHVLEPPDQRARGFIVLIALNRLVPEHVRNVFDEMSVRT